MLRQLRIRIICITMLIAAVMLGVIFATVYRTTAQDLQRESLRMMENLAMNAFRPGRPGEGPQEIHLPYFVLHIGPDGSITDVAGGYYDLSDEEFLKDVMNAVNEINAPTGVLEEYSLRFLSLMTPEGRKTVFADISSERAALSSLVKTSLLIGAGSLLLFFGIGLLFAHIAVKPVAKAWEQQRRFVADASHELKTPLTVIITCAELLKSPEHSEAEKAQFLDSIQTMSGQMRGLTEGLLTLARIDSGAKSKKACRLDLSEIVCGEVMLFEPLCFEKGLRLREETEQGIVVRGTEEELKRLVGILLDNAMKYSIPGGEVSVGLKKQGTHAHLWVENTGESISPEELKNIFKRFYRVDKARSMNHSYGLGLSIAEGIVRAHRGRIWAESANGVNRFNVVIPI